MNGRRNEECRETPDDRLTRRAVVCRAGVVGLAAIVGGSRPDRVVAQVRTTVAAESPEDFPEVEIVAADFSLTLPARIPAGVTRLTLRNEGAVPHHAMIMGLNAGATLAELESALAQPDFGPIFAVSTSLGGPEVDPGRAATTIVDLPPGQYMAICVIGDEAGMPHYLMGMQAPLEVTAPAGAAPIPVADATIDLVDFGFGSMPMQVAPGRHVWAVTNVGEQLHEFLILRQAPGVGFDDVRAILEQAHAATPETPVQASPEAAPTEAGAPPFAIIGGVAPLSPGQTNWAVLDLEAGEHVAICFVPDPGTGAPHFDLGMIMPLKVG